MKIIKNHVGTWILVVIAVLPLILWLLQVGLASVTTSAGTVIASLGKASALSGIALYAVMPILSMRHKFLETIFGGLDKVYRLHSQSGKAAFYIIVAHPLLLGIGRFMNGDSFTTIWDWSSLLVLSGLVAICVFIFVTAVSIYAHIKHQNWIWVHRLFGWILPIFFIHALVARSQIVENKLLLTYMLLLGVLGFSAFLYRSVLTKRVLKRYHYELSEINHFTDTVSEVVLKPKGIPITYEAGQFAFLSFESDVMDGEAHPFSFSNANNGPYVRFTIKALGDDTSKLQKLEPGTKAYIEGPFGQFSYKKVQNKKQVWIAGGIGITPFLSMARSFSGKKEYDVRFFYGTEKLNEAVFLQEFIDITRTLPANFKTTVVSKDVSGFVSVDLLKKSLKDLKDFDYMICGPPGMMRALQSQLEGAGVPTEQVHVEAFSM